MTEEHKNKEYKTIFKSAYQLGDKLYNLFVNYQYTSKSYSLLIKKGLYYYAYNLTSDETIPFLRNCLKELPPEQLEMLMTELKK